MDDIFKSETFLKWVEAYGGNKADATDEEIQEELQLFLGHMLNLLPSLYGVLIANGSNHTEKGPAILMAAMGETFKELGQRELKQINTMNGDSNEELIQYDNSFKLVQ